MLRTCLFSDVLFAISSLNLQPKSLQDKEVDSLWQTADPPRMHPPLLSFRRSRLLSTLSPLSLSLFLPRVFVRRAGRKDR